MKIGFSYDEALDLPIGLLFDFIAVEQIKHEGAKLRREADFWDILEWK